MKKYLEKPQNGKCSDAFESTIVRINFMQHSLTEVDPIIACVHLVSPGKFQ